MATPDDDAPAAGPGGEITKQQQIEMLNEQARLMQEQMKQLQQRIDELQSEQASE